MRVRFFLTFVFVATSLFFVNAHSVFADTGLSIRPIKVSQTIEPGESISGVISLRNESDDAQTLVTTSVEDFIPAPGTTGVQFIGRTEGLTTVRDWITLDTPDEFIFSPGQSRSVRYTITAPNNAEPGGHFGVVFFKATRVADDGQLKVGTQVGVLFFVTIPGNALQKGEIQSFNAPFFASKGPILFTITFKNTGTVHFEPKGVIRIKNIFGKQVAEIEIAGQPVLPTGARDLTAYWEHTGYLFGRYTAELEMYDGEGNVLTADSETVYAFPLVQLFEIVVGILILFYGLKFLKKRVNISISIDKKK